MGDAKLKLDVLLAALEAANVWPFCPPFEFELGSADDGRRSSDDTNEADEVEVVSCTGSDEAEAEAATTAAAAESAGIPCLGDDITACIMSA